MSTPAMSMPSENHRLARWRRAGVATSPMIVAIRKKATLCLFSSATPPTTPNTSHRRSSPVRRMRIRRNDANAQKKTSNAFIDRMLKMPT